MAEVVLPIKVKREDFEDYNKKEPGFEKIKETRIQNHDKIESVVIIETTKMIIRDDVGLKNIGTSKEELEKLVDFLDFNITGETADELNQNLKTFIDQNIDSIVTPSNNSLYFEYFGQKSAIYSFSDFILADDTIPHKGQSPKYLSGKIETLGTGEYQTNENGEFIPHDPEFVKECLLEMIHFQSHLKDGIYDPNSQADISIDWSTSERIYMNVNLKPGYEWDF
jgi:hypothetical protein